MNAHLIASWLQAGAALCIAFITVWVFFFSDAGQIATDLLRAELLDAKAEMSKIKHQKDQLEQAKKQLEIQSKLFEEQKREHVDSAASGYLREIWIYGLKKLAAYRAVAKEAAQLEIELSKVSKISAWPQQNGKKSIEYKRFVWLPNPEKVELDSRSKWGDILISLSAHWQCSIKPEYAMKVYSERLLKRAKDQKASNKSEIKNRPSYPSKNVQEAMREVKIHMEKLEQEYYRRRAEMIIRCSDEWETEIRRLIEDDEKSAKTIRGFAKELIDWNRLGDISADVKSRIGMDIGDALVESRDFADLVIDLKVRKGESIQNIVRKSKKVLEAFDFARKFLDRATARRKRW